MANSNAYQRFRRSTVIDHDKWHDGIGYDLAAFKQMTPAEQEQVVNEIRLKRPLDWRDQELLALADTPAAREALRSSADTGTTEEQITALRELLEKGPVEDLDGRLAMLLDKVQPFEGLDPLLELIAEHPAPKVKAALLKGVRERPGIIAVHCAAMLCYHAGITKEPFEWAMRPFFLRFGNDEPAADRAAAYEELCAKLGVDAE